MDTGSIAPKQTLHIIWTITALILFLAGSALPAHAQSFDETLYVDVNDSGASDDNPGTSAEPLASIQAAADLAVANKQDEVSTRVVIRAGTYRELVNMETFTNFDSDANTTPMLFEAEEPGTVVISGSDVFTDWQAEGGRYWATWTQDWGPAPNPWSCCRQVDEITLRREMVFIDGEWMRQVLSYSAMSDGTFYVDEGNDRIYVDPPSGVDFSSALKEVAVRERTWIQQFENNVTIRGLTFQHAAEPWSETGGSARFVGADGLVVENSRFEWNNWVGIQLSNLNGATLRDVTANDQGGDGWAMFEVTDVVAEDSETSFNNWRGNLSGFTSWSVGNKILSAHGLTIRRHVARGNYSRGLWIDYDNTDVLLEEVVLEDNLLDGMWLEANQGPVTIRSSTIRGNGESGLRSSYSEQVTLENNLIVDNRLSALYFLGRDGRNVTNFETGEDLTLYLQDWTMTGNAFANGEKIVNTLAYDVDSDWPRFTGSVSSSDNDWWHPSDPEPFQIESTTYTWEEWQNEIDAGPGSAFTEPNDASSEPGYQTGDRADVTVDPGSLSFAELTVVDAETQVLTVENTGTSDLTVNDIFINGENAGCFSFGSEVGSFTLAPGGSRDLTVVFAPATPGDKTAAVTIESDDPETPSLEVGLSGSATSDTATDQVEYAASGDQFSLYLGEPVGFSSTIDVAKVELSSAQSAVISIVAFEVDAAEEARIFVNGTEIPVPDGLIGNSSLETATTAIDLSLLQEGTNQVTFETAATVSDGQPYQYRVDAVSFTITYDTENPRIAVDPTSIDFVDTKVGSSRTKVLTVSNTGQQDLDVTDMAVSGADAFRLADGTQTAFTLAGGESLDVSIVFAPTSTGAKSGTLAIESNAVNTASLEVPLTGDAASSTQERTYRVSDNQLPIYLGQPVGYSNSVSVYEVEASDASSASITITAEKLDSADEAIIYVNGTEIAVPEGVIGDNSVETGTMTIDVGLIKQGTNRITFETGAPVRRGARYQFRVDAVSITLGYETEQQKIAVTPVEISFGDVAVESSASQTLTVSNTGTNTLSVSSVSLSGNDAFRLADGTETSFSLDGGTSRDLEVVFEPVSTGSKDATLTIESDAVNNASLDVPIDGNGVTQSSMVTYQASSDQFPLYLGEPVGYSNSVTVSDVVLTDASSAEITMTVYELDSADEARIFVNGTEIAVPEGAIGNSSQETGTMAIDLDLLESGTNRVTFETASEVTDGQAYQFRVDALSFTVGYSGSTSGSVGADALAAAKELPEEFKLDGNYPNPFTSETTLRFDLPEAGEVRIELFDVIGRRVQVLFDGTMEAGAGQTVRVDGSRLGSGMYLYRLHVRSASAEHVETGRMTLVK